MRRATIVVLAAYVLLLPGRILAGDEPTGADELAKLKREYADVLALQGTAKGEILAIARILRAHPEVAVDRTAASGEYCFKGSPGAMVHFATQPDRQSGARATRCHCAVRSGLRG